MVDTTSTSQATIPPDRTHLRKGYNMENKLRMVSANEAIQAQTKNHQRKSRVKIKDKNEKPSSNTIYTVFNMQ